MRPKVSHLQEQFFAIAFRDRIANQEGCWRIIVIQKVNKSPHLATKGQEKVIFGMNFKKKIDFELFFHLGMRISSRI
jgi:hypothetical protein